MKESVIRIENVCKAYRIWRDPAARLKAPIRNLFEGIFPARLSRPRQRIGNGRTKISSKYFRDFYALEDISLEVRKGESLGIIGNNGSGKSTLLQVISGTLAPTSGKVIVEGRVAALLELGNGFNPEFTGKENVFLNAAILGLSERQTEECYAEIAAFADIGDFIDQPVKTYSSGMMVRLAFAVQSAVQPDILIIDEALSVGDVGFRNKCIERIQKMRERGITTLFVSHDLGTLQLLCSRVICLDRGKIVENGDPSEVCQNFFARSMGLHPKEDTAASRHSFIPQQSTGKASFSRIEIDAPRVDSRALLRVGDSLRISFRLEAASHLPEIAMAISVYRSDGDWLIGQTSREAGVFWPSCEPGHSVGGRIILPNLGLAPGDYFAAFAAYDKELKICYALTDLTAPFSVRAGFPVWGKIVHPCLWQP